MTRRQGPDSSRQPRWQPCLQKLCGRLSGRSVEGVEGGLCEPAGDRPSLVSVQATPQAVAAELKALRQHCTALGWLLPARIEGRGAEGRAAIAAIQERVQELEALLAASPQPSFSSAQASFGSTLARTSSAGSTRASTSGSTRASTSGSLSISRGSLGGRPVDAVPCKMLARSLQEALHGVPGNQDKTLIPGRLFMNDVGLCFQEVNSSFKDIIECHIFWDDILAVPPLSPPPSSSGGLFSWGRIGCQRRSVNNSTSCEVALELRDKATFGQLQLQFGMQKPIDDLRSLWNASRHGSPKPAGQDQGDPNDKGSFAGCPVLADFRRCAGPPEVAQQPLKTLTLKGRGMTLSGVRQQMLSNDDSWPILMVWIADKAEILDLSPWEPLPNSNGLTRRLHLRLPLKPMPMAPKNTRISIVYHLKGGENGDPLVITDRAYSLDVPYGTCFMVQGTSCFSEVEAGVVVERTLGVDWSSRVMLKGIIERTSMSEAGGFIQRLVTRIEDNMAPEA